MKKLYFIGLIISLASCNALARNAYKQPFKGGNDDIFVTASLGNTNHQVGDDENSNAFNNDQISLGVNLDYRLGKYFSVGAGYVNFGEAEQFSETDTFADETETFKLATAGSGFTLSAMLHTDIKDGPWFFFIRTGIINWDVDLISELDVTGTDSFFIRDVQTTSGTDRFTGFGGGYFINEKLRVGLSLENYKMDYEIVDPEDGFIDNYKHRFKQTAITATYSF